MQSVHDPLLVLDLNLKVLSANTAFYDMFGTRRRETVDHAIYEIADNDFDVPELNAPLRQLVETGESIERVAVACGDASGRRRDLLVTAKRLLVESIETEFILLSMDDVTEEKRLERRLRNMLEERELLFRELNNRVKNNLLVVATLLQRHADKIDDASIKGLLRDSIARVDTIGSIHTLLAKSGATEEIALDTFVEQIAGNLARLYDDGVAVSVSIDVGPIEIDSRRAAALGLVINEIIRKQRPLDRPRAGHVYPRRAACDQIRGRSQFRDRGAA